MKSQTKKTYLMLLLSFLLASLLMICVTTNGKATMASADTASWGETKYSVSTDEKSLLFVSPLQCDEETLSAIYEVGYIFDGEQPEIVNGSNRNYYTSLVSAGTTKTAADIFGSDYEATTPMIIWEVKYVEGVTYSASAYYKKGTIIEGELYKDYNGIPDEAVIGETKTTALYEQMKTVDRELETFLNDFPAKVTIENYRTLQTKINTVETKLAGLSEAQKSKLSNLADYNEAKGSFMVVDELRDGTVADLKANFTFGGNGYTSINNGITAPNVSSALNHATYGHFVTIGKNAQGMNIRYNCDGIDLTGYTHVTFVVYNNIPNNTWSIKAESTNRVLVEGGVAYGEYATVTMTVAEFTGSAITAYIGAQGSVWISAIIAVKIDTAVENAQTAITSFINDFPEQVTIENYRTLQTKISEIDAMLSTLSEAQKSKLTNLANYNEAKGSFMVVDELRDGTVEALKANFTFGGDGYTSINNGITAPNVASGLKHATYGDFVTIGKNAQGMTIRYNCDGLDLTGYTHVTFVVKNGVSNTTWSVQTTSTARTLVEGGVAYNQFATVTMTVEEFTTQGITAYIAGQGSVWISAIIAVK